MTTMSESHLHFYFLSLLLLLFVFPSSSFTIDNPVVSRVVCRPRQIQTFMRFKSEFDTRGCNHSDNSNGVWCDNSTGVITTLRLRACLSGNLKSNSSLFKLHHLRYLDLSQNSFTSSSLLPGFGNLNKLQVLSLSSNGFLGQVPTSFSNLSLLSYLDLSGNDLIGSIPHVWNLTKLSYLDLSRNHFSGTVNTDSGLFELHHLSYLSLESNNFSSSVTSEFGNLKRLEILSLSSNGFFGQVPSTISNLTMLTALYLHNNELTGRFPLIQNLTELSVLEFACNNFFGTIPSSLFTMPLLSYLDLRKNHLTGSFGIPNSSASSSLKNLYLGSNHFEAKILEPILKLTNLTSLDLSFLNTSNSVDLSLFSSFKSLLDLDLSGNNIHPTSLSSDSGLSLTLQKLFLGNCGISKFPNIVTTLQNLEFISISDNTIKGKIPEWLWSLPHLAVVDINNNFFNGFEGSREVMLNSSVGMLLMESNHFQGALPHLPHSINIISAGQNDFTGEIPLSICNRSSLYDLVLAYNNFTGPVPHCLSNFRNVNLRENNLEGRIPDVFSVGAPLRTLDVGFNRITGKFPKSLINCSSLMFLSVENNNIEDTFPFSLKALPNLQILILGSNKFHGCISPPHQGSLGFPALQIFDIANNKFTGSLSPSFFVNWKAPAVMMYEEGGLYMRDEDTIYGVPHWSSIYIDLHYKGLHMVQNKVFLSFSAIDFSGNLLEGNIPDSIGFLKTLIALDLSNNGFTGHIPLSLANLEELESLDMSRNKLSGTIPNGLGSLSFLAFINVSHNRLTGEIPQGTQITGQHKSSFEGNAGLCGLPLEEICFETNAPPSQHHKEDDEEEVEEEQVLNWKGVAIGYGLGVLFGLGIAQLIASCKPEWLLR